MKTPYEQLRYAFIGGDLNEMTTLLNKLLSEGLDINGLDERGMSPLHNAISREAGQRRTLATELMIDAGANIEQLTPTQCSPLHLAIDKESSYIGSRSFPLANLLIAKGADITGLYQGKTLFEYFIDKVVNSYSSEKCVSAANELMRAGADTMGYGVRHFDTRRHYKIWFSKNPNEFMDIENQLRLVHLTANNPSMTFVLIYSSECLNDNARKELSTFCAANRIEPVDIHSDIKGLCEHPNDIALYELVLEEIEYTRKLKGGNFAAASDCLRLMVPIITKYGMYTDFERQLNIETYPAIIKCLTPIILNGTCNDVIAIAVDPNDTTQLDSDAVTMIRNAQNQLLQNYKQHGKTIISSQRFKYEKDCASAQVIKHYIELHPNSTLYDLRLFIHEINITQFTNLLDDNEYKRFLGTSRDASSDEEQLKRIHAEKYNRKKNTSDQLMQFEQNNMLMLCVVPISGPAVMTSLFIDAFQHLKKFSNIKENIGKMFVDGNKYFDSSWTPLGEQLKQANSDKIKSNILFFQRVIRDNNVRNNVRLDCVNLDSQDQNQGKTHGLL